MFVFGERMVGRLWMGDAECRYLIGLAVLDSFPRGEAKGDDNPSGVSRQPPLHKGAFGRREAVSASP